MAIGRKKGNLLTQRVNIYTYHDEMEAWPFMTLATWGVVTSRNIPIQGVNSVCNSRFDSVSNRFHPNETLFKFLPFVLKWRGRKIDLNLGHRYQNSEICILSILLRISIRYCYGKVKGDRSFGVAMKLKLFSEVRSLDVTWAQSHQVP